ncbi:MAG: hypothetical protein ACOC1G_05135 [Phycisphaeraceae bacterium]
MQIRASLNELTREIGELDRPACIRELRCVPYIRLDFTDDFLDGLPLDSLRHVLMAAVLQARKHHTTHAA